MSTWSIQEVEAIVADYFKMLRKERSGIPFSKTEHRNALLQAFGNRTRSAIEFKHQNISALLRDLGYDYISGYKPYGNYEKKEGLMLQAITHHLQQDPEFAASLRVDAFFKRDNEIVADFRKVLSAPPKPRTREYAVVEDEDAPYNARKEDWEAVNKANAELGKAGEAFVLAYEKWTLVKAERADLAEQVIWTSQEEGDGAGYDILSKTIDGKDKPIEVKTTNSGIRSAFFVTENEYQYAKFHASNFHLYRVYDFQREPKMYILKGSYSDFMPSLTPILYRAEF